MCVKFIYIYENVKSFVLILTYFVLRINNLNEYYKKIIST